MYTYMLRKTFRKCSAILKYFWTGLFTTAYFFLSGMNLTYLPSNVSINRLLVEHFFRLIIQGILMVAVFIIQIKEFKDPFGFFGSSIYGFLTVFVLNIILTIIIIYTRKKVDAVKNIEQDIKKV